jgi:hypothetical protein
MTHDTDIGEQQHSTALFAATVCKKIDTVASD